MKSLKWPVYRFQSALVAVALTGIALLIEHLIGLSWGAVCLFGLSFLIVERLLGRAHREEANARESARQVQLLADFLPQLVWITDLEGNIEYINKRWYEYTGQNEGMNAKSTWMDVTHPDDRERMYRTHMESLASRTPMQAEYRIRGKNGEYRWHLARTVFVEDARGHKVRRFGTATDIHDYQVTLKKLADTRARFDAALQGIGDAVFLVDGEWKVQLVSEVALKSFRRRREDVIGRRFWDVFPELIGLRPETELPKAMDHRQPAHFEFLSPLSERWSEIRAFPFEDGLAIFASDVHDRKLAEMKATAAARQLQIIADAAPASIVYVDARQRYLFANRYYESQLGKMLNEIQGRTVREVLGAESYARIRAHIQDALAGKTVFVEMQVPHVSGKGSMVEATYSPHFGPEGEVLGFVAISQDVSRLRRAEAEVAEREQQLSLITDRLPAFVSYMDLNRRYQFVNRMYEEWFGLPLARIKGKTREELVGRQDTYDSMRPHEARAFAGEEARFELTLHHPSGETRILDTEYLPDKDPQTGRVRGLIGVAHDVTARKKQMIELENAVKARDVFLSIASHELRTPLTGLKLQMEMFKRALDRGDEGLLARERVGKLIAQSCRSLDRMEHLVEDMLDISRIQAGKLQLHREPTEVGPFVRETLERYQPELSRAGIALSFAGDEGPGACELDRFRMEQVLTNLVTNAIRYAPGAPVEVRLARGEGGGVRLSFRDHGPGIAAADRERVFKRFERIVSPNEVGGLGLGLFIVKEIVSAHGGSIRVESSPGAGAEFIVELPS